MLARWQLPTRGGLGTEAKALLRPEAHEKCEALEGEGDQRSGEDAAAGRLDSLRCGVRGECTDWRLNSMPRIASCTL